MLLPRRERRYGVAPPAYRSRRPAVLLQAAPHTPAALIPALAARDYRRWHYRAAHVTVRLRRVPGQVAGPYRFSRQPPRGFRVRVRRVLPERVAPPPDLDVGGCAHIP